MKMSDKRLSQTEIVMTVFPTLYKRTSAGKVQIWFAEVDGDRYRTTSGQRDGKKTTTEWTIAKPKNEGRANATSAAEQAVAEVNAEYLKKLARDYHETLETVDEAMRFKPMLATKWADRKDKVSGQVHMQPKLDGMRCIAKADGLWSREGKPIYGAPHVFEQLKPLFERYPDLIIDGELYNHDLKDDFNQIVSAAKKQKPTEEDLAVSREKLQYWVYDLPSQTVDFGLRNSVLQNIIDFDLSGEHNIVITPTLSAFPDDIDRIAAEYIEAGYEGAMVRLPGKYENKRSNTLIKWKEMQDEEFSIVDIQEGDGNRSGMAARVVVSLPDGRHFSAGLIGNVSYCKQLLAERDEHIGKLGTVVFQNYTPDGVPRFPKFKGVRDYE
jgi:DNA ligase-1